MSEYKKTARLNGAQNASEATRLKRMEECKAKHGRTDLPLNIRKLTQQEAAAYCDVSTATINRWKAQGLKTVKWGKRDRFLIEDLKNFIIEKRKK